MASRASTPAGKRRATARAAARHGRGTTGRKPPAAHARSKRRTAKPAAATKRPATGKRPTPKRGATRRATPKRAAPKRATAKRSGPKRATPKRSGPKRAWRLPRRPSLRTSAILLALGAVALVAGYFGWLRDSSLVAVRDVEVTGVSSPDRERIEAALTEAAGSMTTLHVNEDELADAVAGFPTVVSVSADPDLLHGLAIEVTERPPALIAQSGDEAIPVAGDGTLLRGLELGDDARAGLPVLAVDELPESGKLEGDALAQATILGAAPAPLRPLIGAVSIDGESGVEVVMKGEIPIRFGAPEQAGAKWAAAAAVLADPKLETLTYVDVRVPERPAVGGAVAPTAQEPEVAAPVEPVAEEPVETLPVDPAL